MWAAENRRRYSRDELRYPSELRDEEWALVGPLIPPGKTGGGKRTVDLRQVVNGLMYILSTGCQWRSRRTAPGCVATSLTAGRSVCVQAPPVPALCVVSAGADVHV